MAGHTAYISVGSNMGDKLANCRKGIDSLASLSPETTVMATSSFYKTEPMDFKDQEWFVNAVIKVSTGLDPLALLAVLQDIQKNAGRIANTVRYGPRILDLDIIFYDDLVLHTDLLNIPHPRMHERRFVLQPLCDISPDMIHPEMKKAVKTLLHVLDGRGGEVVGDEIIIKMKKKATTPIFKSNNVFQKSYLVPWLGNKRLRFDWIS